jgi:amino acid transporter
MCLMACIAEMSALAPVSGAFVRHAQLFVDPALSFTIGWSTFYGSAVSVPAEWTAVAVIVSYWSDLNPGIWIAICIGQCLSLTSHPPVPYYPVRPR